MLRRILFLWMILIPGALILGMGSKEAPEKHKASAEPVRQGISGRAEIWSGNFMPMVDPQRSKNSVTPAAGRRIRVYEPVKMEGGLALAQRDSVRANLVVETVCDSLGKFLVAVTPGTYSVFVEEAGGWYANHWDFEGVQGAVKVEADKLTDVLIKISTKATY